MTEKIPVKEFDKVLAVVPPEPQISLGQLMFSDPAAMVAQAKVVATVLKDVIDSQQLFVVINKRQHVYVEGWTTLGAMLGVVPVTVQVEELKEGIFEATVELVRTSDNQIVGCGIAECGDSDTWKDRDRFAKKSMAITRATGKAFRLSYSWIIKLAGYEGTPAEEMNGINDKPKPKTQKQTYTPREIHQAIVDKGLSENVHAAKNTLILCEVEYNTPRKALKWMRRYRGFRAIGAIPEQAAEKANKGETP